MASISAISALSTPAARSAASIPDAVPFDAPTPFWHTAVKTFPAWRPKPGA